MMPLERAFAMLKRIAAFPLVALGLLWAAGPALAQSCGTEVSRLAQQYSLSTDETHTGSMGAPTTPEAPPATTESRGVTTTDRLARSGGVLTPPDTGAPMAIQPPSSNPDRMPTAPQPQQSPPNAGSTDTAGLTAAQRTQMESLLTAARAAERQGKQEQCLDRLREAEAIPGVPGGRARP
jgi:hypothetical protein